MACKEEEKKKTRTEEKRNDMNATEEKSLTPSITRSWFP